MEGSGRSLEEIWEKSGRTEFLAPLQGPAWGSPLNAGVTEALEADLLGSQVFAAYFFQFKIKKIEKEKNVFCPKRMRQRTCLNIFPFVRCFPYTSSTSLLISRHRLGNLSSVLPCPPLSSFHILSTPSFCSIWLKYWIVATGFTFLLLFMLRSPTRFSPSSHQVALC